MAVLNDLAGESLAAIVAYLFRKACALPLHLSTVSSDVSSPLPMPRRPLTRFAVGS